MTDHFAGHTSAIETSEIFFHCVCQQCNVGDVAEVLGDEPDRFFCCHPVEIIESRQVHWARVPPQCAFAAQIKVDVEVTHGQLAQSAVNRLAITAAGEIRFRYRA